MGRTAEPAKPGTNPNDTAADAGDSLLDTSGTAASGEGAAPDLSQMQAKLDAQAQEMAALKDMIGRIGANQSSAMSEPVKLPTMAETLAKKPTVPVLTVEGWFVPLVHPTARIVEA